MAENENENEELIIEESSSQQSAKKEQLPLMLDLAFNLSSFLVFLVALIVAVASFLAGASFLNIILRTGIAIIVVGFLVTTITQKIVNISIDVTNQMLEEASETQSALDN